jgi:hypothetical protein
MAEMQGEQCLAAGLDDYLAKPLTADELYTAIARIPAHREPQGSMVESPVDLSIALGNVDGDPTMPGRALFERIDDALIKVPDHKVRHLSPLLRHGRIAMIGSFPEDGKGVRVLFPCGSRGRPPAWKVGYGAARMAVRGDQTELPKGGQWRYSAPELWRSPRSAVTIEMKIEID